MPRWSWFTRAYWQALWLARRKVIIRGALIGVAIHFLLIYGHPMRISQLMEDTAFDWFIYGAGPLKPAAPGEPPLAFVFVDMDEKTLDVWPAVPYTPRSRLLTLIDFAYRHGAAVIIVDVNLTEPINCDEHVSRSAMKLSVEDQALRDYLHQRAASSENACHKPLILLTRHLRAPVEGCQAVWPSFIEPFVPANPVGVQFASVQFDEDLDQSIRYWHQWEAACDYRVIPSVQWLTVEFLKARQEGRNTCAQAPPAVINSGSSRDLSQRIIYGIPWKLREGHTREVAKLPDMAAPNLTIISAAEITEAKAESKNAADDNTIMKDRVVIIGSSAEQNRDVHLTPIGEMPGGLILANSIYSLMRYGEFRAVPTEVEVVVAIFAIVLASVVFAQFQHLWAYLLTLVLSLAAFLFLGLAGFRHGYWLDITVPLIAVQIHHIIAQFEEAMHGHHGSPKEPRP